MTTDWVEAILSEQRRVQSAIDPDAVLALVNRLDGARRVFLYGVGRNGLVLQALAMRLAHLGLDAHFVGQLAAPPAGTGDLLLVAVALGSLPTADAVIQAGRAAGADLAVITARPERVADADLVVHLPARTMADPPTSPLPLGGAFELALFILCERLVIALMEVRRLSDGDLLARHANLL